LIAADAATVIDSGQAAASATEAHGARDTDMRSIGERAVRAMETTLQQAARAMLATEEHRGERQEPGSERRSAAIANLSVAAASAGDAAASASTATQAMARSFASTNVVERSVNVPVGNPQWAQAMASEVRWLADHGVQAATVRLSPEHLGPVEVRVDVRDSQINVTFGASHADTRAALEQALPKLREMFAGAGLSLGQATVQQEMRRESQNHSATLRGQGREDEIAAVSARVVALGLVDEYA
jgi:flagellar hook-length control protein FliK